MERDELTAMKVGGVDRRFDGVRASTSGAGAAASQRVRHFARGVAPPAQGEC